MVPLFSYDEITFLLDVVDALPSGCGTIGLYLAFWNRQRALVCAARVEHAAVAFRRSGAHSLDAYERNASSEALRVESLQCGRECDAFDGRAVVECLLAYLHDGWE